MITVAKITDRCAKEWHSGGVLRATTTWTTFKCFETFSIPQIPEILAEQGDTLRKCFGLLF